MRTFLSMLLLLAVTMTVHAQDDPPADVTPGFAVACTSGREVIGHRLTFFDLSPDSAYRFSLLGKDAFNPALAAIAANATVTCSSGGGDLIGSAVAVPGVGRLDASAFSTQATINASADGVIDVVVGGFVGESGQFVLVIEGLTVDPEGEVDRVQVQPPPAAAREWLGVFMIGLEDTLDPFVTLRQYTDAELGTVLTCDNAGTANCARTPAFVDGGVLLESTQYVADAFDAGVVGVFGGVDELLYEFQSASGTETGSYGVVMVGTAPGDVDDPALICHDVATGIGGATPAYNALYAPENVLDGDPTTVWATERAALDPETGEPLENVALVVSLDGMQRVNRVRVNTFASSVTSRENSVRRFNVLVTNAQDDIITALEAEARAQPGYQTFDILPTMVDEIALLLVDNYGGSLFEIADVQVCGV